MQAQAWIQHLKKMLTRKDWLDAREQADNILKQAEIMKIVNENLRNIADEKIKELPEEIPNTDNNPIIV